MKKMSRESLYWIPKHIPGKGIEGKEGTRARGLTYPVSKIPTSKSITIKIISNNVVLQSTEIILFV